MTRIHTGGTFHQKAARNLFISCQHRPSSPMRQLPGQIHVDAKKNSGKWTLYVPDHWVAVRGTSRGLELPGHRTSREATVPHHYTLPRVLPWLNGSPCRHLRPYFGRRVGSDGGCRSLRLNLVSLEILRCRCHDSSPASPSPKHRYPPEYRHISDSHHAYFYMPTAQ